MSKRKLGKKAIEFLKNFIGDNQELIFYLLNPYGYMKQSIGGIPYHVLYNLKRGQYIKYNKDKKRCDLTKKGKQEVSKIILNNKIRTKQWDKKWRILIFDIPEKRKIYRQNLRRTLVEVGFYCLQKSVWVFPYDVKNYLYEILPGFREGDWFQYIEADKISSEEKLKEYFGVK